MIDDISVVFLYVADLDRSLAFYRDVLGLRFRPQQDDWIDCPFPSGVRFALHEAYVGRRPQAPGTVTISFAVQDVDVSLREIRAAGWTATGEPTREPFGSFVDITDPDGYRIQLFAKSDASGGG